MNSAKKVIVIPATKSLYPERDGIRPSRDKLRVAAYCRVSTAMEEQQGSYEMQKDYYRKLITGNPAWELAGIYGDKGKSGTSLKGRTGFLEMIDDARAGKIDLIITKATSRFNRNNVDFMEVLNELGEYGVEVRFESEGMVSFGPQNRTMLQVMGATNEHYSNTLSNNVRWSKERRMREGKATISYKSFLGYEKGPDGNPVIVPEEAEVIKQIFNLFLSGMSYASIATHLNEQGIKTKLGKDWIGESIRRILKNEKYTGDVLLQKTYKKSYLDKGSTINRGEKPQVLIENNHPAIIDRATFAKVKSLMAERSKCKTTGTAKSPFNGKIFCNDCGSLYGHRTWNSRGHITYRMWVCNHKYCEETTYSNNKCKSVNLREEWLVNGYLYSINQLLAVKTEINAKYTRKLARIERKLSNNKLESEIKTITEQINQIEKKRLSLNQEYEMVFGKNDEFNLKQLTLKQEKEEAVLKRQSLIKERDSLLTEKLNLNIFLTTLDSLPAKLTKFSAKTFTATIDKIIVSQTTITYYFYGNEAVKVKVDEVK